MYNFIPKFHFVPKRGYMNDPNGMVFNKADNKYHLYFQYAKEISYDEYFGSWVMKNWGHATSDDLINWKEEKIAIKADNRGLIWSGSTVIDKNNTSGLFNGVDPEKRQVSFYACANEHPINGYGKICICGAYSTDGGYTFKQLRNNPVIKNFNNEIAEAFGDPKVFWLEDNYYPEGGIWVMITVFQVRIWTSKDLKHWKFESESKFNNDFFYSECPDLMTVDIDGEKKYIYSGAGKYYFVGSFIHNNGRLEFVPETEKIENKRGNLYANQHFYNADNKNIIVGWMCDHSSLDLKEYGKKWDGYQSIPLNFNLKKIDGKYKVSYYPVDEIKNLRKNNLLSIKNREISEIENVCAETFDIDCVLDVSKTNSFELDFRVGKNQKTRLFFDKTKKEVELNTYLSGKVCHDHCHLPVSLKDDKLEIRLLVDTTVCDLFVDGGIESASYLFFPKKESIGFSLKVDGELKAERFDLYEI